MQRQTIPLPNDDAPTCIKCGGYINPARYDIGYTNCMRSECATPPKRRTVVPMHKSNYILVTDREDLKGINNKGGFYR